MKVLSKQHNSRMCFICGMDNPIGMHAQFYNTEDGGVVCPLKFDAAHQSFPERVHGGIAATMQDELGLRAIWAAMGEQAFGVTMSFEVKFRKPVPYGVPLFGQGLVTAHTSRFVTIATRLIDPDGTTLSNATLKYILLPPEKIAAHADPHKEMCYLLEDDIKSFEIQPF